MNKIKIESFQKVFAKTICLLLVFSVLSFGYQPTCSSMQKNMETQNTPLAMLDDHSCCVQGPAKQNSQLNVLTKIEISKFACQCKSQVLGQLQPNSEVQTISHLKASFSPLFFSLKNNAVIISSIYKAIPQRTAPPKPRALLNSLEKLLI